MLTKVGWYIRRLRVMDMRELLHRAFERLYITRCQARHLLFGQKLSRYKPAEFGFVAAESNCFELGEYFDTTHIQTADHGSYLGYPWQWDGQGSSWHLAPDTKRYWPKLFFSKIDYRQGNPIGDIRVVWEVSRFQQLLTNVVRTEASKPSSTEDKSRVFQHALNQIKSWWSANPHTLGVHYISSMECALRLVAITHIIDTIRNELTDEDWQVYLNFVERHANFIFHRLSLYSSAGNHTIAEATGLVYAGVLFPEFKHASSWLNKGRDLLNTELSRQINKDGGPLEQTTWYLKFIVELGLLANKLLAREAAPLEERTLQRLHSAEAFLTALSNGNSCSFEYGDSDYGYALTPVLGLVRRNDLAEAEVCRFEDTGVELFNLALRVDGSPRIKIMFLTKNLGMAPLFGHGHADSLSVCCAVNGNPMLIDSGTFGYNIGDKWRRYFRSVHAHNTVSVNNLDQSNQLSNFQWSEDLVVRSLVKPAKCDDKVYVSFACHNGFKSAIHYRAILVNLMGEFVVWDCVTANEKPDVVANWHFATQLRGSDQGFETAVADVSIRITTSAVAAKLFRESDNPIAGWCSSAYGEKHGIDTLRLSEQGRGAVSLLTRFKFAGADITDAWWEPAVEEFKKLI